MWLIVLMEIFMFGILILIVGRYRHLHHDIFEMETTSLRLQDGLAFTVSLLCSGFLAAEGVRTFFVNKRRQSLVYFLLSSLFGILFLILKLVDFSHKIDLGLDVEKNDFWQYYWLTMGFHFLHVLVGVFILLSICYGLWRKQIDDADFTVRGGVLFWHMCDLVWLVLFPLFYLGGRAL